ASMVIEKPSLATEFLLLVNVSSHRTYRLPLPEVIRIAVMSPDPPPASTVLSLKDGALSAVQSAMLPSMQMMFVHCVTESVCALEVPPPGAGVTTVTLCVPIPLESLAGSDAESCVELTNVVVRAAPSTCTTEFATKPVPLTVSGNAPPPTNTD